MRLFACQWGRGVATVEDPEPCPETAVRAVVLHDGRAETLFMLCARHVETVDGLTEPHPDSA